MSIACKLLALPLAVFMAISATAFAAEQHVVPPAQLAATVADHVAKQDADRAAVREALARPEVERVAATIGVDMTGATAAVATLSGTDLARAAAAARDVNRQLVGGASTVTISTTTIIIVLLLIILIVVAVN